MKTSEFYTLATNAEMREARIDEILDAIDTITSGCIDNIATMRLLNQYAILLRTAPDNLYIEVDGQMSKFYTNDEFKVKEGRIDECLDAVDMVASGCTDDLSIVRLLNQYALTLRMLSAGSDDQEQGEE